MKNINDIIPQLIIEDVVDRIVNVFNNNILIINFIALTKHIGE